MLSPASVPMIVSFPAPPLLKNWLSVNPVASMKSLPGPPSRKNVSAPWVIATGVPPSRAIETDVFPRTAW